MWIKPSRFRYRMEESLKGQWRATSGSLQEHGRGCQARSCHHGGLGFLLTADPPGPQLPSERIHWLTQLCRRCELNMRLPHRNVIHTSQKCVHARGTQSYNITTPSVCWCQGLRQAFFHPACMHTHKRTHTHRRELQLHIWLVKQHVDIWNLLVSVKNCHTGWGVLLVLPPSVYPQSRSRSC